MIKVLFLIHDLGQGGAEKVLVNLVNNMDKEKFDITVTALFGGGVNEQFLDSRVKYNVVWKKAIPGNSKLMKLLSPKSLHKLCVKDEYDIEISYLEGPSARIISGCQTKNTRTICWIHSNHFSKQEIAYSFRNFNEALRCYMKFDKVVCVSNYMKDNFASFIPIEEKISVLYNVVDSNDIIEKSKISVDEIKDDDAIKIIAVGTMKKVKGFDRLLRIIKRMIENKNNVKLFLLGKGPLEEEYKKYVYDNNLEENIIFLGYKTNPYKYIKKCDIYVCSSYSEGFSTATTEALIIGTAVCTVNVSGMDEMLGENEYGIITKNDEESLYQGLLQMVESKTVLSDYQKKAKERGRFFNKQNSVKQIEEFLIKTMS